MFSTFETVIIQKSTHIKAYALIFVLICIKIIRIVGVNKMCIRDRVEFVCAQIVCRRVLIVSRTLA